MKLKPVRWAALVVAIMFLTSGCYLQQVDQAKAADPTVKPWFCNPIAPNSVTGPGMGSVNFYQGQTRSALDWDRCRTLGAQMDLAKAYAEKYPTAADAEAAGFFASFSFLPGRGTHHGLDTVTPALLADPTFDPQNPIIPGIMDDTFDPGQPEFLQYNGNLPTSRLIGMSWYVHTDTGRPPDGFVGGNDWWHNHPQLCFNRTTAKIFQVNTSDATCAAAGGVNLHMQNYYMVHLWVIDDLEYHADVFAPTHPCILSSGAIFDMADPCHTSALAGAPATDVAITAGSTDPSGGAITPFCSLGLLDPATASRRSTS
jgi:hypothetical protein